MTTLYNSTHNVEYYNVHKTAQTSILQSLTWEWEPIEELPSDRKIICILRDPLDRLISSYFFLRKRNNCHHPLNNSVQSSQLRQLTPQINNTIFFTTSPTVGIKTMVHEISQYGHFDDHTLPQHVFLSRDINTKYGKYTHSAPRSPSNVTHWLNFHNLDAEIQSLFGIQLEHLNKTSKDTDTIVQELRDDTHFMETFTLLYQEDIQLFNEHIMPNQL